MLVLGDGDFARVVSFVREGYGINLTNKRALIQSRLAMYIERRGYASFEQYVNEVIAHPDGVECQRMIDRLSTNHTFFFREPACLEHMRAVSVPALIRRGVQCIDIWCAAASTGQECYTVAMLLEDALAPYSGVTYRVLGSDVNAEVLETAQAGVYSMKELNAIPACFHKRYCRPLDEERFEIAPCLKERITWKQINLVGPLQAFGSGSRHLIFCRNVMIYFGAAAKEALTSELYRILYDDSYVYIGSTETLDMKRSRFEYVQPSVFRKKKVLP